MRTVASLLLLITSAFLHAEEQFVTTVNWISENGSGPRPVLRTFVMWKMSNDAKSLSFVNVDGEVTPLRFLASERGPSSHGVLFGGRDSGGGVVLVNLMGSPLGNIRKIDYSITFKNGAKEIMQYGNASPQLVRCFWALK
jgi:hypothetical protein